MTHKPPSVEYGYRQAWSTKEDMPDYLHPRHQQRIVRLVRGNLTTAGVQWTTWVQTTSTPTSKSSNYIASVPSTISWPGLEGFNLDELEAGLTCALMSTGTTRISTAGSGIDTTSAYRWEYRDNDATTWQALSTFKTLKAGTSTAVERTVSGYGSLGTGYNKIPVLIRLRLYAKGGKMHKMRIKNSSYAAIKPKKQS